MSTTYAAGSYQNPYSVKMFYKEVEIAFPISFSGSYIPLATMTNSAVPFSVADVITSYSKNSVSKMYLSIDIPTSNASASISYSLSWLAVGK